MVNTKRGIGLVEALVGASILTIIVVALIFAYQAFLVQSFTTIEQTQASFLAEEGIEAVKYLRDADWSNISDGTYGLSWDSGWQLVPSGTWIDETFLRSISIEPVRRNASTGTIDPAGSLDSNTKKVSVSVEWMRGGSTTTKTMSTYITNFHHE